MSCDTAHIGSIRREACSKSHAPATGEAASSADLMHMIDCKGVTAHVYGAILNALMKHPDLGPNRKEPHLICSSISEEHRALCAVSKRLVQFYRILYTAPMFPSAAERARFRTCCLEFGANYQWLRDIGRRNGDLIAPVRTKVHKIQHLPRLAGIINPRCVQCYGEKA